MKRFLSVFVLILLLMAAPAYASSKSLKELGEERQRVKNAISATKSELTGTQAEMRTVQLEILDLDESLLTAHEALDTINQTLDETGARLAQTEADLGQARQDRDDQFESFKARARVLQEYGSVSFLDVLLNAASVRDFLARWEFVNSVAKSDQEMTARMQASEEKVAEKVEELARQKNTVEALQHRQLAMTEEMEAALVSRAAYFKELEQSAERFEAVLEQQRETERGIQTEYNKEWAAEQAREAARRAAMPLPQGQLKWPVPSSTRITSYFETRVHPINKKTEHHSGVDIGAKMGQDITAAEDGVVKTASRQGSYGNAVILDHTGGMSTLYGHCSKLLVSVGQSVTRGQVIAQIGSTGVSTGPHLHFEVRLGGKAVNPKGYLGY